ncbi:MAG TPA: hypothetical protein VKS43_11405 [Burkholderiales bacterium]|nr:hypothetical protein [Burkholderiales bacterium]
MRQLLRRLLLAAALLVAQHAAMLHGLVHAQYDVALAEHGPNKAPALGHGTDKCVAFSALAFALSSAAVAQPAAGVDPDARAVAPETVPVPARIAFDSRAPPAIS